VVIRDDGAVASERGGEVAEVLVEAASVDTVYERAGGGGGRGGGPISPRRREEEAAGITSPLDGASLVFSIVVGKMLSSVSADQGSSNWA
jgi:hypothetical protein